MLKSPFESTVFQTIQTISVDLPHMSNLEIKSQG